MLGLVTGLAKATVGVVVLPAAVAADALGAEPTKTGRTCTEEVLCDVKENLQEATKSGRTK